MMAGFYDALNTVGEWHVGGCRLRKELPQVRLHGVLMCQCFTISRNCSNV